MRLVGPTVILEKLQYGDEMSVGVFLNNRWRKNDHTRRCKPLLDSLEI